MSVGVFAICHAVWVKATSDKHRFDKWLVIRLLKKTTACTRFCLSDAGMSITSIKRLECCSFTSFTEMMY